MISFDGKETFESLTLVKKGKAGTLGSRYAGSLRFEFDDGIVVVMNRILSVHYVIEFLANENNYPYPDDVSFEMGLYECDGSSYLRRMNNDENVGPAFKEGKHFIYWDHIFIWHILCVSITVFEGRHEMGDRYP